MELDSQDNVPDIVANFEAYRRAVIVSVGRLHEVAERVDVSDIAFGRTINRNGAMALDKTGAKTLALINQLIQNGTVDSNLTLQDHEDVEDRMADIIDVIDGALEKIDICLDEFTGRSKAFAAPVAQSTPILAQLSTDPSKQFLYAKNILRPQLKFKDKIDNSRAPFAPKIKFKPNALVPLENYEDQMIVDNDPGEFPHPYEHELNNITKLYDNEHPKHMFQRPSKQLYTPFDSTAYTLITKEEELISLCKKLESVQEIAVDLEHHDYRSYQGFTCLVQISTRDEDFIIDALELRHALHALNGSFTNPEIVKVFHGAHHDIVWLQRDFGVYVVNLFDTYHASMVLEFTGHSLGFLVSRYCDVTLDKQFQLADWRIRPLPKELLEYARSDTHYLLYVYDCMREQLLEKPKPMRVVINRSLETSLRTYKKANFDPESGDGPNGWKEVLQKCRRPFNSQQISVFKAIHGWRDKTAREQDESLNFVLPNSMLYEIAQRMPKDAAGVIACCNPPPPLIRMNAMDIAMIIQKAPKDVSLPKRVPKDGVVVNSKLTASLEPITNSFDSLPFDNQPKADTNMIAKKSILFGDNLDKPSHEVDPHNAELVAKIKSKLTFSPPLPKLRDPSQNENRQTAVPKVEEKSTIKSPDPYEDDDVIFLGETSKANHKLGKEDLCEPHSIAALSAQATNKKKKIKKKKSNGLPSQLEEGEIVETPSPSNSPRVSKRRRVETEEIPPLSTFLKNLQIDKKQ